MVRMECVTEVEGLSSASEERLGQRFEESGAAQGKRPQAQNH